MQQDISLTDQNEAFLKELCAGDDGATSQDYTTAIPIPEILEVMNSPHLSYGHPYRTAFAGLFLSGSRMMEADTWRLTGATRDAQSFVHNGSVYWRVGKNQHGQWRHEELGEAYLKELLYGRQVYPVRGDFFFPMKLETIKTRFNKTVRPHLSAAWHQRPVVKRHFKIDYFTLQLKSLRKTNATLFFAKQLEKWKDPIVALEFTAARYHHSTKYITVKHYMQSYDEIHAEKWGKLTPIQILELAKPKFRKEFDIDIPEQFRSQGQTCIRDWQPSSKPPHDA